MVLRAHVQNYVQNRTGKDLFEFQKLTWTIF